MKYFLDTADFKEITKWENYIEGVTSNPQILKDVNLTAEEFYSIYKKLKNVFIQIDNNSKMNLNYRPSNLIYKVPLVPPTIDLLKNLTARGERTCGTITYDLIQFNLACDLGCEFCIVLNAKNENTKFLEECVKVRDKYNFETKIIAASFREKTDVINAIRQGADYASVPPKVMDKCFTNEYAMKDYINFYGDEL